LVPSDGEFKNDNELIGEEIDVTMDQFVLKDCTLKKNIETKTK
jgi:hypothetical protein